MRPRENFMDFAYVSDNLVKGGTLNSPRGYGVVKRSYGTSSAVVQYIAVGLA